MGLALLCAVGACLLYVARAQQYGSCNENLCTTDRRRRVNPAISSCFGGDSPQANPDLGASGSCSCANGKPHILLNSQRAKISTNTTGYFFTCCTAPVTGTISYYSLAAGQSAYVSQAARTRNCGYVDDEAERIGEVVGGIIFWMCVSGCCCGVIYLAHRQCTNPQRGSFVPAQANQVRILNGVQVDANNNPINPGGAADATGIPSWRPTVHGSPDDDAAASASRAGAAAAADVGRSGRPKLRRRRSAAPWMAIAPGPLLGKHLLCQSPGHHPMGSTQVIVVVVHVKWMGLGGQASAHTALSQEAAASSNGRGVLRPINGRSRMLILSC